MSSRFVVPILFRCLFPQQISDFRIERMEKDQRIYENKSHYTVTVLPFLAKDGELDHWGMAMYLLSGNSTFRELRDECWEDLSKRTEFLSLFDDAMKMATLPEPPDKRLFEGLETALGLLNLGYLDPVYLERTAFNPFTILRIGNFLAAQPVSVRHANIRLT
jgi:hypothetical protein